MVNRLLNTKADLVDLLGIPFSDEQFDAISAPLTPGVIIAGAGTGKTTVMAARVVWLVGTGQVEPDQVLGLTFTRKAAAELAQRVGQSLARAGLSGDDLVDRSRLQAVMTYDAFAGRLMHDFGLRIGVEPGQTMITGATRYRLASQAVSSVSGPLPALSRYQPVTVAERLLRLDAELRAHLVSADQVLRHDADFTSELQHVRPYRGKPTKAVQTAQQAVAARAELLGLIGDYRRLKHERNLVEFADQMAQATDLVECAPEVGRQLRERFAVVLLDEYQDTSSAQARLLRALFGGGHPVTAVGDPFQAIYGWRGAAPSNILQFASDFRRPDGRAANQYSLRTNRRSLPVILDAANRLAAQLRTDTRLRAGDADQRLVAPEGKIGGVVQVASFDTWPAEVEWLAEQVVAARQSQQVGNWSQIAVLTRANAPIAAIYEALTSRDVPVEIVGLGGLLDVPEIADIVATLTLIEDVAANPAVVQLLAGPRWRIGPRDLAVLGERARQLCATGRGEASNAISTDLDATEQLCLMDAIEDPGPAPLSSLARERIGLFAAELRKLRRHRDEPVLELVHRVIETSRIRLELDSHPEWFAAGRSRQLTQFLDAVCDYVDIDGDGALSGLLAWLTAERETAEGLDQAVPSNADSVKLLTAHRAKGLEWDLVFLPALCDGTFPSALGAANWVTQANVLPAGLRGDAEWVPQLGEVRAGKDLEEYKGALRDAERQAEDRLGYVAVTRARQRLVATCHHWFPGRRSARKVSPYFEVLRELAAESGGVLHTAEMSETNPLDDLDLRRPWPPPPDEARVATLQEAAAMVQRARLQPTSQLDGPDLDVQQQGDRWRQAAELLLTEARSGLRSQRSVVLPASVSASGLLMANRDREAFATQLARPMPRPVGQQAGIGTRFHRWLENRFGVQALFEPDQLDVGPDETEDETSADLVLRRLVAAFERGRYRDRVPVAVEESFILVLAGQQVRGRIDAVFATADDPDHDYQVVDWKTSTRPADPLQLSLYRLAWAHSTQTPVERVDAVFYHVLSDQVERPQQLLTEGELVDLLDATVQDSAVTSQP
ncbi:MAG: ATP-dependent DNA helicase [Brooklawnia sp.]